jgi:hypothetical protein
LLYPTIKDSFSSILFIYLQTEIFWRLFTRCYPFNIQSNEMLFFISEHNILLRLWEEEANGASALRDLDPHPGG